MIYICFTTLKQISHKLALANHTHPKQTQELPAYTSSNTISPAGSLCESDSSSSQHHHASFRIARNSKPP